MLFTAAQQTEHSLTAGWVLSQSHSCSLRQDSPFLMVESKVKFILEPFRKTATVDQGAVQFNDIVLKQTNKIKRIKSIKKDTLDNDITDVELNARE